ncbi:hypothetical protein KFU94_22995 [Chloroflexi bacterium TSY]|nr:hypothetical protein [Chloroflexi bacterium TSY]
MKLNTFMTATAVVAALYGIRFVLMPRQISTLYGIEADNALQFTNQLFGAALVTFAVLTWAARNAGDSDARRAIVMALFIGQSIGFIVSLVAQLRGVVNGVGWSTVAIYLLLTLGYGYYQVTGSATTKSTPTSVKV